MTDGRERHVHWSTPSTLLTAFATLRMCRVGRCSPGLSSGQTGAPAQRLIWREVGAGRCAQVGAAAGVQRSVEPAPPCVGQRCQRNHWRYQTPGKHRPLPPPSPPLAHHTQPTYAHVVALQRRILQPAALQIACHVAGWRQKVPCPSRRSSRRRKYSRSIQDEQDPAQLNRLLRSCGVRLQVRHHSGPHKPWRQFLARCEAQLNE